LQPTALIAREISGSAHLQAGYTAKVVSRIRAAAEPRVVRRVLGEWIKVSLYENEVDAASAGELEKEWLKSV
jgi:hypothetical protein